MAKRFTKPDFGNIKRPGSPVNSVKNLQRKLNRQDPDKVAAFVRSIIEKAA